LQVSNHSDLIVCYILQIRWVGPNALLAVQHVAHLGGRGFFRKRLLDEIDTLAPHTLAGDNIAGIAGHKQHLETRAKRNDSCSYTGSMDISLLKADALITATISFPSTSSNSRIDSGTTWAIK
jgi:hypothetical protein